MILNSWTNYEIIGAIAYFMGIFYGMLSLFTTLDSMYLSKMEKILFIFISSPIVFVLWVLLSPIFVYSEIKDAAEKSILRKRLRCKNVIKFHRN